ncbi:hypothetical protein QL093DRAFT_2516304 [Fusarium oxysporum]|nr:hypothetical protein QL093DRAFT_2516304 [Fusarium oxysporum]
MPAPQCGLPPPATMTLPPQQPPTAISPPVHHAPPPRLPPPSLTRNWLQAKVEEDKRRREEERTRQESLRLEQRKVEMDMLCTSLQGGIPPSMIPLIFVRMGSGGVRPQMAGSQQVTSVSQAYHLQLLSPNMLIRNAKATYRSLPNRSNRPHQESPPSSSITFYNWQPPISQAGSSSNRPGTPSASTKTKRQ